MPKREWWKTLWSNPKRVLQAIGITSDMTVVDLCCGDGYITAPLASLVEGKVYGIDIDPVMLMKAQAEVEYSNVSVKQWICGDASEGERKIAEKLNEKIGYNLTPSERKYGREYLIDDTQGILST